MLESALADDVELRVVAHRALHEPGQGGAFELGQVFAGEIGDEVSGRVDGSAVDRSMPRHHSSATVTPRLSRPARYDPARESASAATPRVGPRRSAAGRASIERQIREAMDEGAFDDLPYQGERLPLEDDSAAGDWAMAYRMLRSAGAAPPWIEADKEAREQLASLEAIIERAPRMSPLAHRRARADLVRIVEAANRAIARVNAEAPTVRQHRRPLDPAVEAERLERALPT